VGWGGGGWGGGVFFLWGGERKSLFSLFGAVLRGEKDQRSGNVDATRDSRKGGCFENRKKGLRISDRGGLRT